MKIALPWSWHYGSMDVSAMVDMMVKGLKLCRSVALSIHNFLQLQKNILPKCPRGPRAAITKCYHLSQPSENIFVVRTTHVCLNIGTIVNSEIHLKLHIKSHLLHHESISLVIIQCSSSLCFH